MMKSDLIEQISEKHDGLSAIDVKRVFDTALSVIAEAVSRGEKVDLRGFGCFSARYRKARNGRDLSTGKTSQISARHVPVFKASKGLKDGLKTLLPSTPKK